MSKPVVLNLFCGAGGMSLGFEMAGYRIGLGVEKEELPFQTHSLNFDGRCHLGDIGGISDPLAFVRKHGLDRVDVAIGGPLCQGFSRVGRGEIRSLRQDPDYIHDPRNQYYREFVRFVEAIKPSHFIMENVPDLRYYLDGEEPLLQKALRRFEELGYTVDWQVLAAFAWLPEGGKYADRRKPMAHAVACKMRGRRCQYHSVRLRSATHTHATS